MMNDEQITYLDYETALTEVIRIVKHVMNETIIEPNSSFDHDFIIIAQAMLKLELSLHKQINDE
jgi:hypothetical protein